MNNSRIPTGRAATPEAKRAVVERLLTAWERSPHQRLGQLIDNALKGRSLFAVEDESLLEMVENHTAPGEVAPAIKTSASAPPMPWGEKLTDNDAAKIGLDPAQDPIAAIERGAFVAVAKVAHRDGMTWAAVAEKILANVEPDKLDLAHAVLSAARRRGMREPGLVLLVSSTAISSPTTEETAPR